MRPENAEEAREIAEYEEQEAKTMEDICDFSTTEDTAKEVREKGLIGKESPLTFEVQIRKMANEISAMKIDQDDNQGDWEEGYNQAIQNVVSRLEEWENAK